MSDYRTINIDKQDFVFDLDPDVVFNFTHDHIKFLYTNSPNGTKISRTITTKQLDSKEKLKIHSVLCCKSSKNELILVIVASNKEEINHIFCYRASDRQVVQVDSKIVFKHDITQASLTREAFDVTFMDKTSANVVACYALIIGTNDGNTALLLLHIRETNFEAKILSVEQIKDDEQDLGHVTAIHILPPDRADRRMGHSDPQILLGYSKGGIFIYRFRANIYVRSAPRLREPVNLSAFAEFPNYPITRLSSVRAYNSLVMTVAFSQEKPLDNIKYQYSSPYVKVVETHGETPDKQKKMITPDDSSSMIVEAKLLVSNLKTKELDNMIQLSTVFEGRQDFELSLWDVSANHNHQQLDMKLEKDTCMDLMSRGTNSNIDDLRGFYKNTPQKLVQCMLEYKKDPHNHHHNQDVGNKRKHDGGNLKAGEEQEEEKVIKKGKVVLAHSDEENLEAVEDTQSNDIEKEEFMEDVIEINQDTNKEPVVNDIEEPSTNDQEHTIDFLDADSVKLERSIIVIESLESTEVANSAEVVESTESVEEDTNDTMAEAIVKEKIIEMTTVESINEDEAAPEVALNEEKNSEYAQNDTIVSSHEEPVETIMDNLMQALVDESAGSVLENLIHSAEETLVTQVSEEPTARLQPTEEVNVQQLTPSGLDIATLIKTVIEDTTKSMNDIAQSSSDISTGSHTVPDREVITQDTETLVDDDMTTPEKQIVEGDDIIQEESKESKNKLGEDYVFVQHEDVPENADVISIEEQMDNAIEEHQTSPSSIKEHVRIAGADENAYFEEQTQDQIEQSPVTATTNEDQDQEKDYEEEMDYGQDYGQDYGDDGNSFNLPPEEASESNDICEVISSDEEEVKKLEIDENTEESIEEEEDDQLYLEEDQNESDKAIEGKREPDSFKNELDYTQEDKDQDEISKDDYDELENSTIVNDLSNVGSIQQSFVPASNTLHIDTTYKENSTSDIIPTVSTIDYIPVMQQDLFRLLEEANIPLHSNNDADITTSPNLDNTNLNNNIISGTEANLLDSFTSLPPEEPEVTQEEKDRLEMEQRKLVSEDKFRVLLDQHVGIKDIDSFMKQPLISKEQLDRLGNACWFSEDSRLKLLLIQYCDIHGLGEEVVSLCRHLLDTSMLNDFSEHEESEFKRIYRKYYKDYPSYNNAVKVINIFTQEGRLQLLQKESNYLKFNNSARTNSRDQKKSNHNYMQYYGFGFLQKL